MLQGSRSKIQISMHLFTFMLTVKLIRYFVYIYMQHVLQYNKICTYVTYIFNFLNIKFLSIFYKTKLTEMCWMGKCNC